MKVHEHRRVRRIRARAGVTAVLTLIAATVIPAVVATTAAHAAAPVPFTCASPTLFYTVGNPTQVLTSPETSAPAFTPLAPGVPGYGYNAVAFDPVNGLIYAQTDFQTKHTAIPDLLQIDATGNIVDLGALDLPFGSVVASFDPQGNYWSFIHPDSGPELVEVNVATLAVQTFPIHTPGDFNDMTYSDGFMWALQNSTNRVERIDTVTGAVDAFAVPGLPADVGGAGLAFTYANGDVAFNDNAGLPDGSGVLYRVSITDPASASPTLTLVATYEIPPGNSGVDGTSCYTPADLSLTKTAPASVLPGGQLAFTLTVADSGGNSLGYTVTDTVPASVTDVATSTPGCSVTGNTLTCTEGELDARATFPITVTGTAPSTQGATITNTASVTGSTYDTNSANNTGTSSTKVATLASVCRGSGLRLPLGITYAVANAPLSPCATASANPVSVKLTVGGLVGVNVSLAKATTSSGRLSAASSADVASATLTVAGHTVSLLGMHAQASSQLVGDCAHATVAGSSAIGTLIIDGKTVVLTGAPQTVNLGVAVLYLNESSTVGNTVTQRAVFLDLPGTLADLTLGEAIAGESCR